MEPVLTKTEERPLDVSVVYITDRDTDLSDYSFTTTEYEYIRRQISAGKQTIAINSYFKWSYLVLPEQELSEDQQRESFRQSAARLFASIRENEHEELLVVDAASKPQWVEAFLEGLALSCYQFLKYKKDRQDHQHKLQQVLVYSSSIAQDRLEHLKNITRAVCYARDLVNEPLSHLDAGELSRAFENMGKEAGFSTEIFNKKKIEALKLRGLLAVNQGSVDPPSFSVMEWKPEDRKNERPVVLIGKGIVYDTGGISLKPTSSMLDMKSDMAGAATVAGIMYAAAMNRLPLHLIGLVPATDNRPGNNAYTPGDVITMHDDTTVEVINTDAEGRMVLADALSFARQYDPELVFDFATLTGSASVVVGPQGILTMGNAQPEIFERLLQSGQNTYERLVQLPLWKEYQQMIRSDVADIKNAAGKQAGAITAGKFLEYFTDYPWVHFDIAPMAFLEKKDAYRCKGGTGIGIRLMVDFLSRYNST